MRGDTRGGRHPTHPPTLSLSQLHGAKGLDTPWTRLAATAPAGATTLALASAATGSWGVGDELALASTDFDPYQTERVKVAAVAGARVTLAAPLRFKHYGQVDGGMDQRAEVALLTRSIRVVGADDAPGIGCHTIVLEGFTGEPAGCEVAAGWRGATAGRRRDALPRHPAHPYPSAAVHVEGVEYTNCGQADSHGRYPVHFHMAARVPAGTYVRAAAVHDSNFRAYTLHGTQASRAGLGGARRLARRSGSGAACCLLPAFAMAPARYPAGRAPGAQRGCGGAGPRVLY